MAWPATLPQYVDGDSYTERRVQGKLETEMDSGPKQMRNLFTATPVNFGIKLTLTSAQVDILDTFYYTTCLNGTLEFTWIHPRTYAGVTMRFIGEPPNITVKAYDAYTVTFSVEILP